MICKIQDFFYNMISVQKYIFNSLVLLIIIFDSG